MQHWKLSLQPRGTVARLVALGSRLQRHKATASAVRRGRGQRVAAVGQKNKGQQQWSPLDSDDFDDADSTSAAPQEGKPFGFLARTNGSGVFAFGSPHGGLLSKLKA